MRKIEDQMLYYGCKDSRLLLEIKNTVVVIVFIFLIKHIVLCGRLAHLYYFYTEEAIPCTNFRLHVTPFACTLLEPCMQFAKACLTTQKIKILKWQSHDVWFLRYQARQTEFLILDTPPLLSPPPPPHPNNLEKQNFEKWKKYPERNIVLHLCNINHNHMMYGSWDTKHEGQNCLSFWTDFSLIPP